MVPNTTNLGAHLSSASLADKASGLLLCVSIGSQSQALDVSMGSRAIVSLVALHLTNLDHLVGWLPLFPVITIVLPRNSWAQQCRKSLRIWVVVDEFVD